MLVELRVTALGVIEDQTVLLGPGLTALTGETGAGKTLLVDAISLLTGAPSDPTLVAPGAAEARIEGRFEGRLEGCTGGGLEGGSEGDPAGGSEVAADTAGAVGGEGEEHILTRVIPAAGRSRGYIDGRMVSLAQLAAVGRALVDIHGQHAHQYLLSPSAQRSALDRAAGIDTAEIDGWRRTVRELTAARAELGGDPRERARQIDLLSYQLSEIDSAGLADPEEDTGLQQEEELLADAAGLVETAGTAWEALAGDGGLVEQLGAVVSATASRRPLAALHARLAGLQEELADVSAEARRLAETVEDDPGRLAAIGERRRTLTELRRKYGGSLGEVIDYREELRGRLDELASHDQRAAHLEAELDRAGKELAVAYERVWEARRTAAPKLARGVEQHLQSLAMPRARFSIEVGPDPAQEQVTWMLGANPGQPLLPLAKVASGGELSRAMLATRLVMGRGGGSDQSGPSTLIFDEVDAGIGGEAAIAVGRALAALARGNQVLVVTHLAQVAAFADSQLTVTKDVVGGPEGDRTVATARRVEGEARVVELARMLSGRPDSESARRHAEELLAAAEAGPSTEAPADASADGSADASAGSSAQGRRRAGDSGRGGAPRSGKASGKTRPDPSTNSARRRR